MTANNIVVKRRGVPLFSGMPIETVRKAPIDPELKPQKTTKRVEEGPFRYSEDLKWRFNGYSRPFSDSLRETVRKGVVGW